MAQTDLGSLVGDSKAGRNQKATYAEDPQAYIEQTWGEGGATGAAWMDTVNAIIGNELTNYAKSIGQDPNIIAGIYTNGASAFFQYLQGVVSSSAGVESAGFQMDEPRDLNAIVEIARGYWRTRLGGDYKTFGPTGSAFGGSGGGRKYPTEAEIRQQFDLSQLAEGAQNQWRGLLLEEMGDPRALAREYVDKVVATKGQQKIDFDQFVKDRIRAQGRYASIYSAKPESVSEEDFLGVYTGMASSVARPKNVADLAIGGAMFGAAPGAFAERLKRTDAHTGSAPFINEMQNRMTRLKGLFKG